MATKQTPKTTKKTTVKPAVKKTVKKTAPVAEHAHCCCEHKCACKCHHSGFWKKLVLIVIFFALGFASAKLCCCHKKSFKKMPRPEFDNGCLVVKCPKLEKMVPMMDADKNGCVTVEEFKAAKKHAPHHNRKMKRQSKPHAPVVAE
jgi:hypothetical protein